MNIRNTLLTVVSAGETAGWYDISTASPLRVLSGANEGGTGIDVIGTVICDALNCGDGDVTNVGNIALDSITADDTTITITGNTTFADGAYDFDIASHDTSNGLKLGGVLVTSTADELNLLDGSTANTVVNSKAVVYGSSGELKGTLSTAAQGNVTSLGTLTTLTVDDITVNGNTISSNGSSTLAITPKAGQAITFDGTITLDAGVVTGATSITSTAFVGDLTGDVTGNADTATTATNANHVSVADNESTNENDLIPFIENASATGNVGLESDGDFHYNPSTGKVTAPAFAGNLTGNVTGNADTATALETGRTIGMTGDVVWTSPSFDGSGNVTAGATLQANTVDSSQLVDGSIDESHLNVSNSPSDNQILSYNHAGSNFTWVDDGGGGASAHLLTDAISGEWKNAYTTANTYSASWVRSPDHSRWSTLWFAGTGLGENSGLLGPNADLLIEDIWSGGGTATAWIKPDDTGKSNRGMILNKYTTDGWYLSLKDAATAGGKTKLEFKNAFFTTAGVWITTSAEISLHEWNHVAVTYDGAAAHFDPIFYINGKSVAVTQSTGPVGVSASDTANRFAVGNGHGNAVDYGFSGEITDIKMLNRILDEDDVNKVYRGQRLSYGDLWGSPTRITTGNLVADKMYRIIDPGSGGDWTNVGAPNNNANTEFRAAGEYNGDLTPTSWGGGSLIRIGCVAEWLPESIGGTEAAGADIDGAWTDSSPHGCDLTYTYVERSNPIVFGRYVGIGTSSPRASLHVTAPSGVGVPLLVDSSAAGSGIGLRIAYAGSELFSIDTPTGSDEHPTLYDKVGGSWTAGITLTGGKVGMGTLYPDAQLHVKGDMHLTGNFYDRANSAGSTDQVLKKHSSGGLYWANDSGGGGGGDITDDTEWNAKGDLIVGTGSDTAARLGVGADDYVLTADSSNGTFGIAWKEASGGGGTSQWTDTGTVLHPTDSSGTADDVVIGGTTEAGADIFFGADGAAVFNEQGAAVDFRVESDDNANMLFVDGSEDKVGIGTSSPTHELTVAGTVSATNGFAAGVKDYEYFKAAGGQKMLYDLNGPSLQTMTLSSRQIDTMVVPEGETMPTGKTITCRISAVDWNQPLVWHPCMRFVGETPLVLAKDKVALLTVTTFGPVCAAAGAGLASDIVCSWAVED